MDSSLPYSRLKWNKSATSQLETSTTQPLWCLITQALLRKQFLSPTLIFSTICTLLSREFSWLATSLTSLDARMVLPLALRDIPKTPMTQTLIYTCIATSGTTTPHTIAFTSKLFLTRICVTRLLTTRPPLSDLPSWWLCSKRTATSARLSWTTTSIPTPVGTLEASPYLTLWLSQDPAPINRTIWLKWTITVVRTPSSTRSAPRTQRVSS